MAILISRETPLQDDVRVMVEALNNYLKPLSPAQFQFQMSVEEMADENTIVFVARDENNKAAGMGSLKIHDVGLGAALGEVKRMYTVEHVRGKGVGRQILDAVEGEAANRGLERLVLETGSTKGFESAWRVYERGGYKQCEAVLDYPASGYSRFYEKML